MIKDKITILGDSLTLPRPGDGVNIDDPYPLKISQSGKLIVLNKSQISADTDLFLENQQVHYDIRYANSQYFILHLGICDCSPRIFTKKEKKLLVVFEDIPLLKRLINLYIAQKSKKRLYYTKRRQIQNVSIDRFGKNYSNLINEILKYNSLKKIYIVNILQPSDALISRSFGLDKLVKLYNAKIDEICKTYSAHIHLIDLYAYTKENPGIILNDGHHFNKQGHDFIYQQIIKNIC